MSETSSFNTSFEISSAPAERIRRRLGLVARLDDALPTPESFRRELADRYLSHSTGPDAATSQHTRAQALAEATTSASSFTSVARPDEIAAVETIRSELATPEKPSQAVARSATQRLDHLTTAVAERLERSYAEELEGLLTDAFREDLGCAVESRRHGDRVALRARSGDRVALVRIERGTRVELDIAGCEGPSCGPWAQELLAALRRRGLEIRGHHARRHDRSDGSNLAARARSATARGDDPLVALLRSQPERHHLPAAEAHKPAREGRSLLLRQLHNRAARGHRS